MGEHGWLHPSTSISTQQGSFQGDGSGLSLNDTDCTGLAQQALVLGPGQSVGSGSIYSPTAAISSDTAFQRAPSLRSQEPESACLAPRASVIQGKGFS